MIFFICDVFIYDIFIDVVIVYVDIHDDNDIDDGIDIDILMMFS